MTVDELYRKYPEAIGEMFEKHPEAMREFYRIGVEAGAKAGIEAANKHAEGAVYEYLDGVMDELIAMCEAFHPDPDAPDKSDN